MVTSGSDQMPTHQSLSLLIDLTCHLHSIIGCNLSLYSHFWFCGKSFWCVRCTFIHLTKVAASFLNKESTFFCSQNFEITELYSKFLRCSYEGCIAYWVFLSLNKSYPFGKMSFIIDCFGILFSCIKRWKILLRLKILHQN